MRKQADVINELKTFWGVKEFIFEAQYAVNRKGNGFFRNLRKTSDKSKIFLPNGNQLTVGVSKELKFEEDKNFLISVFVPNDEIRAKFDNDYTILLDTRKSPPKAIESEPESYVKSLEREYRSVIGIGLDSLKGAIKRISYDINRKPETFIFELLQNADDYPDRQKGRVVVSFKIVDEYLVFQHNGLPFSANNVRALCSVDAGDKEYDFEKIGYKGIGFKSIFKHSNYVVIHSGGYTFKFDENYHRSRGIDTFWQLIPLWTDLSELPENVQNQVSNNFSVTVIIKPEEGNSQLRSYEETFNAIFKDERVLLFLRHVEHFSFRGTTTNIVKRKDSDTWAISKLDAVLVPDELQKTINAKIKVDDRIPQKYEDIEKTVLTFATRKIEGKLVPTEQSHLYAYLPTDLDFGFPFLLNGDFIPDGGRHYLHADLEWNQFLFKESGKNLLKWIASIWSETKDIGAYDMLPDEKKLISERPGDEKEILLKFFFVGLSEEKNTTKFIAIETNELCSVPEIVLDDTGLFSKGILPNSLYYNISNSTKKLPHPHVNLDRLFSSYLELERFTSIQLIDLLSNEENKVKLKEAIKLLESNKYLELLSWFNTFCYVNSVSNAWLLSIPIVLAKDDVFSLTEVLSKSQFFFKNQRTKNVEGILAQIGFDLSELYIDDQKYNYLYGILLQQESYLKSDLKLYERIAAAKDLSKLKASEKNTLIAFFESLVDVGPAKYAKALPLFKSNNHSNVLKPLNSLISNKCEGLPTWLNDFVIDADEENALATVFQNHLLKEKDLLEKLFCNVDSFTEITSNINAENIAEFYTYLLNLHNAKPEDLNIDFSKTPWVFIESSCKFVLASTVYWPESITDLTPVKYASVKTVIEAITDEQLPHFAALQIKKTLALGGKAFILSSISPKENEFDVLTLNAFLDWLEVGGEKDFLNHFSIAMQNDTYSIIPANGSLQYYTTDADLHSYIQKAESKFGLTPFPKDIYTENRHKIGLLEGDILLEHLIRVDCSLSLARFVNDSPSADIKSFYIYCLENIELSSQKKYTKHSDEHIVIKLILEYGKEEDIIFDHLISRICIDGHALHATNISDKVVFKFKPTEFQQEKRYELKLSGILSSYKDQTYALSIVANNFIDIENKALLERKVFRTQNKKITDIFNEIHSATPEYFSPLQMFFLLLYERDRSGEKKLDVRKGILDFDDYWFSKDKEKYHLLSTEMLDILFQQNYHEFSSHFIFSDFDPANKIFNDYYALETEVIPHWIKQWIESGESAEKKAFLKLCGVNDTDSPVFLLRKSLIEKNKNDFDRGLANIANIDLLQQTASWLKNQQDAHGLILTREFLHPLYAKMLERAIPFDKLPIPVLVKYGDDNYKLVDNNGDNVFHIEGVHWGEYHEKIFNHIIESGYVVDDALPLKYLNALNPIKKPVVVDGDLELLQNNSSIFSEEYFLNWSSKETYPIQVYRGDLIPYTIKYNNVIIDKIQKDSAIKLADVYYVVETEKSDIPYPLKGLLPKQFYDNLLIAKVDFARKLKLEQRRVTFTEEEQIALKNLFEDEIPTEFYKDLNLASCVSGLVVLSKQGYDVKKANVNLSKSHLFAQITPVYKDSQDTPRTIMCRSARKGILYITKKAWDRLDQKDISLFVKFGENEKDYFFFEDKTSLLKVSDTKYQVFRVEADSEPENTDAILSGKFNPEKIWLIFKIKENDSYKSIFDGGIRQNEENPDWDNVNASEDSVY